MYYRNDFHFDSTKCYTCVTTILYTYLTFLFSFIPLIFTHLLTTATDAASATAPDAILNL